MTMLTSSKTLVALMQTVSALFVSGGIWLLAGNTLTARARGMAVFLMAVMAGSAP